MRTNEPNYHRRRAPEKARILMIFRLINVKIQTHPINVNTKTFSFGAK